MSRLYLLTACCLILSVGRGQTDDRLRVYESKEKSELLAFTLSFVLPGSGSVYAGHTVRGLALFGAHAAGTVFLIDAVEKGTRHVGAFAYGLFVLRVLDLSHAVLDTDHYNRDLRTELGISIGVHGEPCIRLVVVL